MNTRALAARPARAARYVCLFDLLVLVRNRVRMQAMLALARSPMDVGSLAAALELELSHVSRCLGALEAADLVAHDCRGHKRVYKPGPALGVVFAGGGASVRLKADSGSEATLVLSPEELAELEGRRVVITPAAALSPTGSAPRVPRSPSGPG